MNGRPFFFLTIGIFHGRRWVGIAITQESVESRKIFPGFDAIGHAVRTEVRLGGSPGFLLCLRLFVRLVSYVTPVRLRVDI